MAPKARKLGVGSWHMQFGCSRRYLDVRCSVPEKSSWSWAIFGFGIGKKVSYRVHIVDMKIRVFTSMAGKWIRRALVHYVCLQKFRPVQRIHLDCRGDEEQHVFYTSDKARSNIDPRVGLLGFVHRRTLFCTEDPSACQARGLFGNF